MIDLENLDWEQQTRVGQVNDIIIDLLGRPGYDHELRHFLRTTSHGAWEADLNAIRTHYRATDEFYRRNTPVTMFPVSHGEPMHRRGEEDPLNRQTWSFHSSDYLAALEAGGETNVRRTRQQLLNWLTESSGERWLNPEQEAGQPGSIVDEISATRSTGEIHTRWGDPVEYPESVNIFNRGDLLATKAMGFSNREIQTWLDENEGVLRPVDAPGVEGGVYESVRSGAVQDTRVERIPTTHNVVGDWSSRESNIPDTPDVGASTLSDPFGDRASLNIEPNATRNTWMEGNLRAGTGGINRRRARPKYTSTKDLSREMRLNRS